jgi:hypothetical protein
MKKIILFIYILLSGIAFSQTYNIQWQKCLGGTGSETARNVIQTSDGGYISVGYTQSVDGDVTLNHGSTDVWVQKVNSIGTLQWQKCYGGSLNENGFCIISTTDGGYMISGLTFSNDGEVSGNHTNSSAYHDAWLIKIDNIGNIQWQKCYGSSGLDYAKSVIQTSDGGYIFTGCCAENNGDVTGNHGNLDVWCVKVNSIGVIQWQKSYGGTGQDESLNIKATSDGGYVICGFTSSNDGDVTGNHGGQNDAWLIKIDNIGNIQWQKCYGGLNSEIAHGTSLTFDGGFIFVGYSNSTDGDLTLNYGSNDVWVVKVNNTGVIQWQKTFGGSNSDKANEIIQTNDGSYLVSAITKSNDINITDNHGTNDDLWLIKISSIGNIQWQKCYGSFGNDYNYCSIQKTTDGGVILAGGAANNTGDVSGFHGGMFDLWLVKLSENNSTNSVTEALKDKFYISPNPITSTFTINGIESIDNIISINLTDINGKIVKKMELDMLTFNIQEINSGVYLLVINTRVSTETKRIIKL